VPKNAQVGTSNLQSEVRHRIQKQRSSDNAPDVARCVCGLCVSCVFFCHYSNLPPLCDRYQDELNVLRKEVRYLELELDTKQQLLEDDVAIKTERDGLVSDLEVVVEELEELRAQVEESKEATTMM